MTLADEMALVFGEAALVFEDAFHASTYVLYRVDRDATPDGWREQARTMVESGRCELLTFGTGGGYGSGELTLAAETGYGAELPKISAVTLDDILVIDGREFQIVGVMRPDPWGMFLQVGLQEMA